MLQLCLSVSALIGQEPTSYIDFLNMTQLRDEYLGKRFTYRFSTSQSDGVIKECLPFLQSGTRVLEVGRPLPGSIVVPYRFTHTIDAVNEPGANNGQLIAYWEAGDGKESRRFCRFLVGDQCSVTPEHLGFVNAGPAAVFIDNDPLFLRLNWFGSAMALRGNAPQTFTIADYEGFRLSLTKHNHPVFGKTYILGNNDRYFLILSEPEFLLLGEGTSPDPDTFSMLVDELVLYNGTRYPKRGVTRLHQV